MSDLLGARPTRLTWVLEDSGGRSGETVFPYLTWEVAEPVTDNPVRYWQGCRPDAGIRRACEAFRVTPGPAREKAGCRPSTVNRSYVATTPKLAAAYQTAPHHSTGADDTTGTWGPVFLLQMEALPPPTDQEPLVSNVSGPAHPAEMIYPRVLRVCVRLDWSTPEEATSRIRALNKHNAMGDCCHA